MLRTTQSRIDNGVKAAAFEVRTDGSTIDHPKQLHYIPLHDLDEAVSFMNSTPHAMKLEEAAKPQEVEEVEVELSETEETPAVEEDYVDVMDDIEELMDFEDAEF